MLINLCVCVNSTLRDVLYLVICVRLQECAAAVFLCVKAFKIIASILVLETQFHKHIHMEKHRYGSTLTNRAGGTLRSWNRQPS